MQSIEVENVVKNWLLLEDKGVVRLILASMLANFLPTPPCWMFLVGESSGGKSTLLNALKGVEGIFPLDDMTTATFASGMKGQSSNSLLYQLPDNGTVLIKDYTTMLTKDKESRGQILGQMRKIFDGDYRKKFGNGEEVIWQGKMGMIAGVTPAIYDPESMAINASLGERYLYYHMTMPDRFDVGMIASEETEYAAADIAMTQAFSDYLNPHIARCKEEQRSGEFAKPTLNAELRMEIVQLAELATRARSSIKRNMYSRDKDQEMPPSLEMTPRFTKSLICLALAMLIMHRYDNEPEELTEQDKSILFKVALDSIPLSRRMILESLTMFATATESGLVESLSMNKNFINIHLWDLKSLGLVNVQKSMHSAWLFELKPQYREMFAKYRHMDMSTKTLEAVEATEEEGSEFESLAKAGLI